MVGVLARLGLGKGRDLQGEGPVLAGQDPDEIRPCGYQNVVDGGSRCDDTRATCDGRASSEPRDDISGLLIVKRLSYVVSRA